MLIPTDYTPVQITVPDDRQCESILDIWCEIYNYNQDEHSYISHIYLARTYNLIYTIIKIDNLKEIYYPYTEVPLISAENINFYKLNENKELILKEENDIQETINSHGIQSWYKDGNIHRDNDLPAIIHTNGSQEWYKDGYLHRDNDLPAVIFDDGRQEWYQHGLRHRDNDLPALIYANGTQFWVKHGKLYDNPS